MITQLQLNAQAYRTYGVLYNELTLAQKQLLK